MSLQLSDEMKALLAALTPMIQTAVDAAVSKIPYAGPVVEMAVDTGIAAIKHNNPKYFPSTGVQSVVSDPNSGPVAIALGNAPLVPAQPDIAPSQHEDEDVADLHNRISILEAKVEALSAATGLQTSAAMAAH